MYAGVCEYWIADPRTGSVLVYFLEQSDFQVEKYTFNDKIKAGIYDGLYIDFADESGEPFTQEELDIPLFFLLNRCKHTGKPV